MAVLDLVVLGAGNRGAAAYGDYALRHAGDFRCVAVAEPDRDRRESFAALHGIPAERTFDGWEALLAGPCLAEAAIVATQDRMHFAPAMAALAAGYHVLLEKPMATDPLECLLLAEEAEKRRRVLLVCHVLRYTSFFSTIAQLIADGRIGQVVAIQHNENVGHRHMAHSYVRGNWRRGDESSPMILAKSCHDMDLLLWLAGADCLRLSSFGGRGFFRPENSPLGAAERCLDNCSVEPGCPFSARLIYLGEETGWPVSVISRDASLAARTAAIQNGPYGRCVFACDNDVVDHQVVAVEFVNGVTAAFTMCGLTHEISRTIKIMGTGGEIGGHLERNEIALRTFADGRTTVLHPSGSGPRHAGGDEGIMRAFRNVVNAGRPEDAVALTRISVQSHLMAFAAEQARLDGSVINLKDFGDNVRRAV